MCSFSCVLWAIFWSFPLLFYLPHHRSENASKTHPKSSHDKFKTASEKKKRLIADYVRIAPALGISPEEQERQVNLMLDDLVKLLKQKK